MNKVSVNRYIASAVLVATFAMPLSSAFAYTNWQNASGLQDPQTIVCQALAIVGMGCSSTPASSSYKPKTSTFNFDIFGSPISQSDSNSNLTANISGAANPAGEKVILVRTSNSQDIYEISHGRKHPYPTLSIFYSYGFTLDMVETISQQQLDKYPRANLLTVYGDAKHFYYFTEGGMTRVIPDNDKVFDSYGDRKEDAIVINQTEFNFYPVDQYVFLENPLNRDIFQITSEGKRYLTPMAVIRMGISQDMVAPINQTELDTYKTLAPVVY